MLFFYMSTLYKVNVAACENLPCSAIEIYILSVQCYQPLHASFSLAGYLNRRIRAFTNLPPPPIPLPLFEYNLYFTTPFTMRPPLHSLFLMLV